MAELNERDRIAAVAALYRIPPIPASGRALELVYRRVPLLASCRWPGDRAVACALGPGGAPNAAPSLPEPGTCEHAVASADTPTWPFSPGSFDLVILHRTLDELGRLGNESGRSIDPDLFLAGLLPLLSTGGVVAGCIRNRLALPRSREDDPDDPGAWLSVGSCRKLLRRAGFAEFALYGLYPDERAPAALRGLDARAFRWGSLRSVRERRAGLGGPGYFSRSLYARSGLGRFFPPVIFFWAVWR